jgi:hypothetical protein
LEGTVATLSAATGIGSADDIDTSIDSLIATNSTSGNIDVQESDGLVIAGTGVRTLAGNGSINVDVDAGDLTVDSVVTANGSGTVTLNADAGTLDTNAVVSSTSGAITLTADMITQAQDVDVTTSGAVIATADNGSITMADGSKIVSTDGTISLEATGDITLGQLEATNNATDTAITVTSSGGIFDGGDADGADLIATTDGSRVTLEATGLVGIPSGVAANALDTNIVELRLSGTSAGLSIEEQNSLSLIDNFTTDGDMRIIYGTSTADNGARLLLNDNTLTSTNGSITLGANRTALDFNGVNPDDNTAPLADATIYNQGGGDITISAQNGDIIMGAYEKLTVAGADAANPGNLVLEASNMTLSDLAVAGDLTLDADGGVITILERGAGLSRNDDTSTIRVQDDRGTDIVALGTLRIVANQLTGDGGALTGTAQDLIGIGGGTLDSEVPDIGGGVVIGSQVTDNRFSFDLADTNTFDYIASPANPTLPFVAQFGVQTIDPEQEELSEALRDELLGLRIFARDLTVDEEKDRRDRGFTIMNQLIVDEAAPISAYQVAAPRISEAVATEAVSLARELFGEDNSGMEAMGEAISNAYSDYQKRGGSEAPAAFAEYLQTSSASVAGPANEYLTNLDLLLDLIEQTGLTETEINISFRNILSRLRVDGLRGRDLIEFIEAYRAMINPASDELALKLELFGLRIFARDLTNQEEKDRRDRGYTVMNQLIVDEGAPLSDYQVAVSRISGAVATDAVTLAKKLFGEDNSGMEAMGKAISKAYSVYLKQGGTEAPVPFAEYIRTSSDSAAERANGYLIDLDRIFDLIEQIGLTESEINISRRNILSRLRVEGLRGHDLVDFIEAYREMDTASPSLGLELDAASEEGGWMAALVHP